MQSALDNEQRLTSELRKAAGDERQRYMQEAQARWAAVGGRPRGSGRRAELPGAAITINMPCLAHVCMQVVLACWRIPAVGSLWPKCQLHPRSILTRCSSTRLPRCAGVA